jgi:hypothetical protein
MQACVKLLHDYQVEGLKCMARSCKVEGDYHWQRCTTWLLWKEGIKTLTCSAGYRASTVARKAHSKLYMSGITTHLKNDAVKPCESSQGDGSHV